MKIGENIKKKKKRERERERIIDENRGGVPGVSFWWHLELELKLE